MAIDSTSTLQQVQASYDDNAGYEGYPDKCRAFILAGRILIRKMATEAGTRESHFKYDVALIQKEIQCASEWLAANEPASAPGGANAGTSRLGFNNFRC